MVRVTILLTLLVWNVLLESAITDAKTLKRDTKCGPFGFKCIGNDKVRLCDDSETYGPIFVCPRNKTCNAKSAEVCENMIEHIDPLRMTNSKFRCHRYERLADTSVPGCKGYMLCIPNQQRFVAIKFKCGGSTIFNPKSKRCTTMQRFKCDTDEDQLDAPDNQNIEHLRNRSDDETQVITPTPPIDCKNYRLRVPMGNHAGQLGGRPAFLCRKEPATACTIFSNQFCVSLAKEVHHPHRKHLTQNYRREPRN